MPSAVAGGPRPEQTRQSHTQSCHSAMSCRTIEPKMNTAGWRQYCRRAAIANATAKQMRSQPPVCCLSTRRSVPVDACVRVARGPHIRDGMREDLLQLRQLRLCGTPHLKNLAGDGATEIAEPATAEAERREHRRRRLPDFRTEDAFRDDFRIGLAERRGHPEQRVPRAPRRDERLGGELAAVWVLVWICQREGGSCARSPTTRLVGVALTTLMRDAEKGRFDALRVKCVRRIEAKYVEGRRL
eukprot:7106801-Prymnesium_polylepis.1